jgi:hypothetical protein
VALLPARPKKAWMERQSIETAYLVDLCTSDFQMTNEVTQFTWQDHAHLRTKFIGTGPLKTNIHLR